MLKIKSRAFSKEGKTTGLLDFYLTSLKDLENINFRCERREKCFFQSLSGKKMPADMKAPFFISYCVFRVCWSFNPYRC